MRHKFTFFIGLIATVVFGASLATPIFAEEDNTQDSIEPIECTGNEYHSYCGNEYHCTTDDAGIETCEYVTTSNTESSEDVTEESWLEPISAESAEPEEDPEMWPVYLSLGAIGVTFLLIVIINLTSRKYNQK